MKLLINIIKIIHRLVYCLLLPIGIFSFCILHILYAVIMIFVRIISYIFKGNFCAEDIFNIESENHIVNKLFIKLYNIIYPNYK